MTAFCTPRGCTRTFTIDIAICNRAYGVGYFHSDGCGDVIIYHMIVSAVRNALAGTRGKIWLELAIGLGLGLGLGSTERLGCLRNVELMMCPLPTIATWDGVNPASRKKMRAIQLNYSASSIALAHIVSFRYHVIGGVATAIAVKIAQPIYAITSRTDVCHVTIVRTRTRARFPASENKITGMKTYQ